jgi:hypothetical protein
MGHNLCGLRKKPTGSNRWSHHRLTGLQTCYNPGMHKSGDCTSKCRITCLHGKRCLRRCGEPCVFQCKESCGAKCKHQACNLRCDQQCTQKACEEDCEKQCQDCVRGCKGVCGEPCPPCPCKSPFQCPISLAWIDVSSEKRIYQLPDCKCLFELPALDGFVASQRDIGDGRILRCPKCHHPICRSIRYAAESRQLFLASVLNAEVAINQRLPIIRVVELEAAAERGAIRANWYQCPNGHPYFVGACGVPRETGQCIDCGKRIGADLRDNLIRYYI